jgi:hypothetical protein
MSHEFVETPGVVALPARHGMPRSLLRVLVLTFLTGTIYLVYWVFRTIFEIGESFRFAPEKVGPGVIRFLFGFSIVGQIYLAWLAVAAFSGPTGGWELPPRLGIPYAITTGVLWLLWLIPFADLVAACSRAVGTAFDAHSLKVLALIGVATGILQASQLRGTVFMGGLAAAIWLGALIGLVGGVNRIWTRLAALDKTSPEGAAVTAGKAPGVAPAGSDVPGDGQGPAGGEGDPPGSEAVGPA